MPGRNTLNPEAIRATARWQRKWTGSAQLQPAPAITTHNSPPVRMAVMYDLAASVIPVSAPTCLSAAFWMEVVGFTGLGSFFGKAPRAAETACNVFLVRAGSCGANEVQAGFTLG